MEHALIIAAAVAVVLYVGGVVFHSDWLVMLAICLGVAAGGSMMSMGW